MRLKGWQQPLRRIECYRDMFCGTNSSLNFEFKCRARLSLNGVPYRLSRDEKLSTPSGPEGSSGSSGIGRRDVAGAGRRHLAERAVFCAGLPTVEFAVSYQVLARKWRPQNFTDLVGQEHVVKALVNALETGRLHHAYLFTGTRGVGKTTIARIFAKSLNCESGVSAEPCGTCSVCQDIMAGRFFDLIEVDAASNTGVDDTRELLENAQYKPTSGRYKVYLIDEVHMFSRSSFNALLKTLEEPPEHVKFLLATTEQQKLPPTVLSRCLQFNLKSMPQSLLAEHLATILKAESIEFEPNALAQVARVADGSVRDSLSLVEQVAALGEGTVKSSVVENLLGVLSATRVVELVRCIAGGDAEQSMAMIAAMSEFSPDYSQLLADMLSVLHHVAMQQMVPGAASAASDWPADALAEIVSALSPEDVQLFYQIALQGQRDMPHAPLPRESFEMTVLRMLHFRPVDDAAGTAGGGTKNPANKSQDDTKQPATPAHNNASSAAPPPSSARDASELSSKPPLTDGSQITARVSEQTPVKPEAQIPAQIPNTVPNSAATAATTASATTTAPTTTDTQQLNGSVTAAVATPVAPAPTTAADPSTKQPQQPLVAESQPSVQKSAATGQPVPAACTNKATSQHSPNDAIAVTNTAALNTAVPNTAGTPNTAGINSPVMNSSATNAVKSKPCAVPLPATWNDTVDRLAINGAAMQLARNCSLTAIEEQNGRQSIMLTLTQQHEELKVVRACQRLEESLASVCQQPVQLVFHTGEHELETVALRDERLRQEAQRAAEASIAADPVVKQILERVDGELEQASIQPVLPGPG